MIHEAENQLRLLELKCRRPVEHLLAGEYHSVFRGQGIEFEDVRPYLAGDDVRMMDWKITARTGVPHIKRYIEEREQFIYLLCDFSASILDSQNRRNMLAEMATLITLSAIMNHDRVSLILFTDEIELMIPPGKGRQHARRIMEALLEYQPTGRKTSFNDVLGNFGHMAPKHSVAFVMSDFLASDYLDDLGALAGRHDMNAVNLLEPEKIRSEFKDLVHISDSETAQTRYLDLSDRKAAAFERHQMLEEQMLENGINLMEVSVGEDCVSALAQFFRTRQRRIADETGG